MWAKAKEKSKKEAKKQAEHGESTGRKPRHSGTKKTLPTSISATRAQSVTL